MDLHEYSNFNFFKTAIKKMKPKQNLKKNINTILIGLGLLGFASFANTAKADEFTPDKCIDAIGAKVDGKYTKTAAQIGNSVSFCTETPERFVITIHELGLCTSQPITVAGENSKTFSKDNCVTTMTSDGIAADLASGLVALPSMDGRPESKTYTHAYIIITNTFGLRGSVTLKDATTGAYNTYCSMTDEDQFGSNSTGATTGGSLCTPENHTEILDTFGSTDENGVHTFDAYFPDEEMDGGGSVSALLTKSDANLTTAQNEGEVERLIGVFETNSGSPVVINDATNGLEMELTVTDIGYGIAFGGGEPIYFGSMPFKPIFSTF